MGVPWEDGNASALVGVDVDVVVVGGGDGSWLLVGSRWTIVVCCWLLVGYLLVGAGFLLFVIFPISCSKLVVCCLFLFLVCFLCRLLV